MRFRPQKKTKSGTGGAIDITAIVDIVFNLLIFFALTLNFAATSGGINVKLPSASSAEPVKADQVSINLTKEEQVYYNDEEIDIKELASRLKAIEDKDSIVVIRADDAVPHGKVVEVMDIIKSQGLSKLAIAVQAPSGAADTEEENNEE